MGKQKPSIAERRQYNGEKKKKKKICTIIYKNYSKSYILSKANPTVNREAVHVRIVANDFECYAIMPIRYLTLGYISNVLHTTGLRNNFHHTSSNP